MALNTDKIDEAALALLYLTLHDDCRAWKGMDWDVSVLIDPVAEPNKFDLISVMTHEFGHWLRLGHTQSVPSVMSAFISTGVQRREISAGDGYGALKVFYAEGVRDDDKALFIKIIADHFKEKHVEVQRKRIYRCPECREVVRDRVAISRANESKKNKIFCQHCGESIPLDDALETLYRDDRKFLTQIAEMETRAEASMERGGELVSAAAELRTENFKAWAGGADIAAGTRSVFDDELLTKPFRQPLPDDACRDVGRAGRTEGHDQPHRPRRIGLRPCDARDGRQRGSARGPSQNLPAVEKFHLVSSKKTLKARLRWQLGY